MDSDMIIVLDGGAVDDIGTHDELMRNDGIYRRNYELQMKSPEDEDGVPPAPQTTEGCHE